MTAARSIGRYALHGEIASGGMATVHLARLLAVGGFARTVAVKRLHPQFAKDPEFVTAFLDEARLAARIRHPNVVPTLDVVATEGELFLVMEWIQGESLAKLRRLAKGGVPLPIACGVLAGALHGLHAAHEAHSERGEPLKLVHRDISPQNILIGIDGVPRVTDFGVAKAAGRVQTTREGKIKGKLRYMAPEQLLGKPLDRRADVFAAAIVLWEVLARRRLFRGEDVGSVLNAVLNRKLVPPSAFNSEVDRELDAIVMRGLCRDRDRRWPTALAMAVEIERVVPLPSAHAIGAWVQEIAGESLGERAEHLQRIESHECSAVQPIACTVPEVETPPPSEPGRRPRALTGVAIAALLAAVAISVTTLHARPSASERRAAEATVQPSAERPPPPAPAPRPRAATSSAPSPSARPVRPPPRPARRAPPSCDPPYTFVTTAGKTIRRWKPGCS
jgi:serine/threonine-protein kinase